MTGTQAFTISGTISPAASGSGATVTMSGPSSGTTTADSGGNYSFAGLANGSYTVAVSKTGVTFTPTSLVVTIASANSSGNNFTAGQTYSISGTITPAASGISSTVTLSGAATAVTTADASGNYTFTGLANGAYTVTPTKTGFSFNPVNASVTLNSANATVPNFAATQVITISGTISPAASGTGTTITLSGASTGTTTADVNGNYSFTVTLNGNYTVTPTKTGVVFIPVSQAVTVNNASATADFTSDQTYSISGTISPIFGGAGTNVSLSGAAVATTTTDVNGNYSFLGLLAGSYTVAPASNAFTYAPSSATVVISTANATANFIASSAAGGETLFTTQVPAGSANDNNYELGTAFTSDVQGKITAIRFWKANGETTGHTGNLWSASGQLLASVAFANETLSGWQQQALPSAVSITANTTYIVSVNTTNSTYMASPSGLATQIVSQDLSSVVGSNGIFGTPGTFPTTSFSNTNYFRDVAFTPTAFAISGTVSTAANGTGTTLTLSGAGSGTATADVNGNFTFSPMPNGTYTVTPSKSGLLFSPTSKSMTIATLRSLESRSRQLRSSPSPVRLHRRQTAAGQP